MEACKYNPTYRQLWDAAQQGRAGEVRELIHASKLRGTDNIPMTHPLSVACFNNWPAAAQALLDGKASPNAWWGPKGIPWSHRQHTALHAAACHGHVEVLRLLVLAKADVNQDCSSAYNPLQLASAVGQTDVVRYLLSVKACPRRANGYGRTPVELAARHGHPAVLRVLVSAHADPANI
jgi:ankyrin repeat protein